MIQRELCGFSLNEVTSLALSDKTTVAVAYQKERSKNVKILIENYKGKREIEFQSDQCYRSVKMQFVQEALCILDLEKFGVLQQKNVKWLGDPLQSTGLNGPGTDFFADQSGLVAKVGIDRLELWDLAKQMKIGCRLFEKEDRQSTNRVFFYHTNQLVALKARTIGKNNQLERYDIRQSLKPIQIYVVDGDESKKYKRNILTAELLQSDSSAPVLAIRATHQSGTGFINLNAFEDEITEIHLGPKFDMNTETTLISNHHNRFAHLISTASFNGPYGKPEWNHNYYMERFDITHELATSNNTLTLAQFEKVHLGTSNRECAGAMNKTHLLYLTDSAIKLEKL